MLICGIDLAEGKKDSTDTPYSIKNSWHAVHKMLTDCSCGHREL